MYRCIFLFSPKTFINVATAQLISMANSRTWTHHNFDSFCLSLSRHSAIDVSQRRSVWGAWWSNLLKSQKRVEAQLGVYQWLRKFKMFLHWTLKNSFQYFFNFSRNFFFPPFTSSQFSASHFKSFSSKSLKAKSARSNFMGVRSFANSLSAKTSRGSSEKVVAKKKVSFSWHYHCYYTLNWWWLNMAALGYRRGINLNI